MVPKLAPLPRVLHETVKFRGGVDLITPTLDLPPGVLRDAVNFEVSTTGGYSRIAGYERHDGRPIPSNAIFAQVVATTTVGTIVAGDAINGQTSGATGTVFLVSGLNVFYTKSTGTFQVGENLRKAAVVQDVIASVTNTVTSAQTTAQYNVLAAAVYRSDIAVVPGSGAVRGVVYYNNNLYAWRDDAGATAMVLFKASTSGWTTVPLGWALDFTATTGQIFDGNAIVGATSGATGTVSRAVLRTGVWTGVGTGTLILSATAGVFVVGENIQVAAVNKVVSGGAAVAQTLLPGGRVQTDNGALSGGLAGTKIYGCDNVNPGFEFDGTSYVKIKTGMTTDVPSNVKVHKNRLFFSFVASLQFSGAGTPYVWSPLTGAGELSLNDPITALLTLPGSSLTAALGVYSENSTSVLYGTTSADWQLATYNQGFGARKYSAQILDDGYVLDNAGVVKMRTTQAYGNFTNATLTNHIRPFVQQRRNRCTASLVNNEKSQYRLFFSDSTALYITVDPTGKMIGCMPQLFLTDVTCTTPGEVQDGQEIAYFGSTDGFVYRLDSGPNFDGSTIAASLFLNYDPQGESRYDKRYRKGSLEIQGSSYVELNIGYDLAYSDDSRVDQETGTNLVTPSFTAPFWDTFVWDAFVWDGRSLAPVEIEIKGTAENIALRIDANGNYFEQFTINSLILHYTMRKALR
jgi:hypothetical protein